jgi:hypothetical protein
MLHAADAYNADEEFSKYFTVEAVENNYYY